MDRQSQEYVLKLETPESHCVGQQKTGLKYFSVLCAGVAALSLLTTSSSVLALEPKPATVTSIVAATRYQPSLDADQVAGTSDIVDILRDNPALLCSLTRSNSLDAVDTLDSDVATREASGKSERPWRGQGLNSACANPVSKES